MVYGELIKKVYQMNEAQVKVALIMVIRGVTVEDAIGIGSDYPKEDWRVTRRKATLALKKQKEGVK